MPLNPAKNIDFLLCFLYNLCAWSKGVKMAENLVAEEIKAKPIVFVDHSLKISANAFFALCRALNQRRPCCSKDNVSQYFIMPKPNREYGA